MSSRSLSVILALVLPLAFVGCPKKPADSSAPGGTPASDSSAGPSVSFSSVGVTECDDYLRKVQDCINGKVPGNGRQELANGIESTAATWRQLAGTPEGKDSLPAACTQALDAARSTFSSYGCSF
jgi:hypothetical protein